MQMNLPFILGHEIQLLFRASFKMIEPGNNYWDYTVKMLVNSHYKLLGSPYFQPWSVNLTFLRSGYSIGLSEEIKKFCQ